MFSIFRKCRRNLENGKFNTKTSANVRKFLGALKLWKLKSKELTSSELAEIILEESGYIEMWQNDRSIEADGRLENLKELVGAVSEFDNLNSFLEHMQLVMDNNVNNQKDTVNLLTLHAANKFCCSSHEVPKLKDF